MAFVKERLPCVMPDCDSSDAAGLNEDGSVYCFSCQGWANNYDNPTKFRRNGKDVMGLATKAPVPPSKPVEKVTNIKTQTLKNKRKITKLTLANRLFFDRRYS